MTETNNTDSILAVMAYALLNRECPVLRPSTFDIQIRNEVMDYFCHHLTVMPADRWECLTEWVQLQSPDDTKSFVARLRAGPDTDATFMAALIGAILQTYGRSEDTKGEVDHVPILLEAEVKKHSFDPEQVINTLKELLFGTFRTTVGDVDYIAPDETELEESVLARPQNRRRQSLSETFHSFTDSPALNKSAKRRRLDQELVAESERENEELLKENAELKQELVTLSKKVQKLEQEAERVESAAEMKKQIQQLKEALEAEEEKGATIKKLALEKETLQMRLSKALDDKNKAECDVDDIRKERDHCQTVIEEKNTRIKEVESAEQVMAKKAEYWELEVTQCRHAMMESTQLNDSRNDSRVSLSSEPPSFSKMNTTDTPNMQMELEMDRLKNENEQAAERQATLQEDNDRLKTTLKEKESELKTVTEELEQSQSKNEKSAKRVEELEKELEVSNKKQAAGEVELKRIKREKVALEQTLEEAKAEQTQSLLTIKKLQEKVESGEESRATIKEQLDVEETKRRTAEDACIKATAKLEEAVNAQLASEARRSATEADKVNVLAELEKEKAKRHTAEKAAAETSSKLHEAELAEKTAKRSEESCREENERKLNELTKQHLAEQRKHEKLLTEFNHLKEQHEANKAELESKKDKLNILRQENEKSTIEAEQTKVQLESIKTELESKQDELNTLRQENEKSAIEAEQVKIQLETIKTELESKQDEICQLKKENDTLETVKTELKEDVALRERNQATLKVSFDNELQVVVDRHKVEESQKIAELDELKKEIKTIQSRAEQAETKLEGVETKLSEESTLNKRLTRQNNDYKIIHEKYQILKKHNEDISKKYENLQKDSTELQRKYKSKKEENETLKMTIKELRTENSRHITSNNELNIKLEQEQRERTILEENMTALTKTNQELSLKLQAEQERSSEESRLTESALSQHDQLHSTLLHQPKQQNTITKVATGAADEQDDEDCITVTSIQRLNDAANLKSTKPVSLQRTHSAGDIEKVPDQTQTTALPKPISQGNQNVKPDLDFAFNARGRRAELERRNEMARPHLRSSNPLEHDLTPTKDHNSTISSISSSQFNSSTPLRLNDEFKKPLSIKRENEFTDTPQDIRSAKKTKRRLSISKTLKKTFKK